MGPAPAQVAGERLLDVDFTRVLAGGQEGGGLHDHAVDAVAALHGLLIDEGLLHGMRPLRRAETFQRDDLLCPAAASGITQERTALPSRCTVHAPHWARPQPKLGPWSPRSLRRA